MCSSDLAGVSVTTAFLLWPLIPKALALPSPSALREANAELEKALIAKDRALRQISALLDSAPDATIFVDRAGTIVRANRQTERLLGYSAGELTDKPVGMLLPELSPEYFFSERPTAPTEPEPFAMAKDGHKIPVEISRNPIETDRDYVVCAALRDVTERKRAECALRNSEAKLAGILAIAGDAIVSIDASYRISLFNEAAERMFGYSPAEVLGQPIDVLIPTRFHAAHQHHIERFASGPDIARRMGEREEVVARRKNGDEFPTEASISKLDVGGERFYTVVLRDVTERKRAEKHQGQLVAELDHRVKNVLARVAAVAMYTGQGSSTMEELLQTLEGRIQSLSDAHVLLSHSRWKGVGLTDLVHHQLAPYVNASNTAVDGPEVMLTAVATEAVAMVLYELVTNAAKYGALSTPQGRVSVTWAGGSNGRSSEGIVIKWREMGGPLVAAPTRLSYGTKLIRDLIPHEIGGVVDLTFAKQGVSCIITLPPEQLTNL